MPKEFIVPQTKIQLPRKLNIVGLGCGGCTSCDNKSIQSNKVSTVQYCFTESRLFLSDLMEIIAWLLHPNEGQRATLQDIRRDPWVQQPIRIDDYKWKKVLPNCGEGFLYMCEMSPTKGYATQRLRNNFATMCALDTILATLKSIVDDETIEDIVVVWHSLYTVTMHRCGFVAQYIIMLLCAGGCPIRRAILAISAHTKPECSLI